MGLLDRLGRVIRANLNSLISQAEDPEKILEQTVIEMQDELVRLRQAVAQAIATQKRTERQASQSAQMAEEWYRRAQLALQKGDETLAREALARRKSYQETADSLRSQLGQQQTIVSKLKQNMMTLESKLSEAKTKKDMYIARARSAKASQQLNEMLNRSGTNKTIAAFERMEEKVMQMEAQAEATAELAEGDAIERQFRVLEGGGDIDAELASLKAQLTGNSSSRLPSASGSTASAQSAEIDSELEQLRAKLEEG
ncbi:phage shock protein A [filamentous cyanobacterium CCP1]|nr:phage shock protein A [filamentous cyanobacterium CCP2]PSB65095.1 phage shock protein A [filamentous cyanobacterium CCP1]